MITRFAEGFVVLCMSLAGLGAGSIVGDMIEREPVGMRLISIEYDNGTVTQSHDIFGVDMLQATWAANVTRGQKHICSGGGFGVYSVGSVVSMSLDEWVGDKCPAIELGDKLKASWEWSGNDGVRFRVSGSLTISD